MLIHLDTDFAGDTDDAAALAMLLGWPDVELVGVTTVADPDGSRAGYVAPILTLAGRDDVPVAVGAGASLTTGGEMGGLPDHDPFWGDIAKPTPPERTDAVALLGASVDAGATIVAIGPFTNLALLERERPGALRGAHVVVMGGWVEPPPSGYPQWEAARDWNVQCDTDAAREVFDAAENLTIVTLAATVQAPLREAHLAPLEAAGPLGELLARQGRAHAADEHDVVALGQRHPALPDDLLNFQHDPLACAVALGWPGAPVETRCLRPQLDDDVLWFAPDPDGKRVGVVVDVDGEAFADRWIAAIEEAARM